MVRAVEDVYRHADGSSWHVAEKMSRKCKFCIGCCVFWVVFLAVMIPVSLKVIAPKVGQLAMDWTSFHIANYTIYGSPNDGLGSYNGWVHNTMNLHSPIFIGAVVHEVNVTMVANQPGAVSDMTPPFYFSNGPIGWFSMPETTVTKGDNWLSYDVPVHFNSTADDGFRFPSWAFYLWGGNVVYIDLVAEAKMTALGFVTMRPKMIKTIACNCIPNSSPACTFPKTEPTPDLVPNLTWSEDPSYYEPLFDNKTMQPFEYPNATIEDGDGYLPIMTLFCEPVGTPVYNGSDIMPVVSTTTSPAESGFSV